jgi:hypothetical protein
VYSERGKTWDGEITFPPVEEDVRIRIASEAEPGASHHAAFAALVARYESLRPAIGAALFGFWRPHLDDWNGDLRPVVTTEAEMLEHTKLEWIRLSLSPGWGSGSRLQKMLAGMTRSSG